MIFGRELVELPRTRAYLRFIQSILVELYMWYRPEFWAVVLIFGGSFAAGVVIGAAL